MENGNLSHKDEDVHARVQVSTTIKKAANRNISDFYYMTLDAAQCMENELNRYQKGNR